MPDNENGIPTRLVSIASIEGLFSKFCEFGKADPFIDQCTQKAKFHVTVYYQKRIKAPLEKSLVNQEPTVFNTSFDTCETHTAMWRKVAEENTTIGPKELHRDS